MLNSVHELGWTIEDLNIFATGPVSVSYGDLDFEIEGAALRLYGVSHGTCMDEIYAVAPGAAHFLISGASGQTVGVRWAMNATPITAFPSAKGWRLESFTVEHVDGSGKVWQITIPETTWE